MTSDKVILVEIVVLCQENQFLGQLSSYIIFIIPDSILFISVSVAFEIVVPYSSGVEATILLELAVKN